MFRNEVSTDINLFSSLRVGIRITFKDIFLLFGKVDVRRHCIVLLVQESGSEVTNFQWAWNVLRSNFNQVPSSFLKNKNWVYHYQLKNISKTK